MVDRGSSSKGATSEKRGRRQGGSKSTSPHSWRAPTGRQDGSKSTTPTRSSTIREGNENRSKNGADSSRRRVGRHTTPSPSPARRGGPMEAIGRIANATKRGSLGTGARGSRRKSGSDTKPAVQMNKEYKQRVYKEWIQRRNALDLGRPLMRGSIISQMEQASSDVSSTESSEEDASATQLPPPSLPTIGVPQFVVDESDDQKKASEESVFLDAADNAALLGRSTKTGALIRRLSHVGGLPEQPAEEKSEYYGLSEEQVKAFREVFDLFDGNGGGTIDADELDETLRSVGICLESHHMHEVMLSIDADGNGEIDFEEFLRLMTNTERFLDSLAIEAQLLPDQESRLEVKDSRERNPENNLLFEALTEFMKKSALNGMPDIVDYYHNKYKRVQVPHVVNHYAAGARLIGLTEKQIKQHLERLKVSNAKRGGLNSPYALPLHIVPSKTSFKTLDKTIQTAREENKRKRAAGKRRGTIRLVVRVPEELVDCREEHVRHGHSKKKPGAPTLPLLHHVNVGKRGFGWVGQRTEHIQAELPGAHLRNMRPFDELTAEDLPAIRKNVNNATREYRRRRRQSQLSQDLKHWRALDVDLISPRILRHHFRVIFSHYSGVQQRLLTTNSPIQSATK